MWLVALPWYYCSTAVVLMSAWFPSCAEYQLARPSDSHRKEMLFGSLARAGHPMAKFFWGETHTHTHTVESQTVGSDL